MLSGQGAQRWRAGRCTQASVRPVPPGPEPQGAKARPTPPGAPAGLRGLRPRTGALGPPAWGHTAASISRLVPEIIRTDAVCSSTLSPAGILPRLRNLSAPATSSGQPLELRDTGARARLLYGKGARACDAVAPAGFGGKSAALGFLWWRAKDGLVRSGGWLGRKGVRRRVGGLR